MPEETSTEQDLITAEEPQNYPNLLLTYPDPPKKKNGGKRPGAGPKKKHWDLQRLEMLAAIQCTDNEIASNMGCSARTVQRRMQEPKVREIIKVGRERGRTSIRRQQFRAMEKGSVQAAIWLGKQYLGQRDKTDTEITLPWSGNPKDLTDAQLEELYKSIAAEMTPAEVERLRRETLGLDASQAVVEATSTRVEGQPAAAPSYIKDGSNPPSNPIKDEPAKPAAGVRKPDWSDENEWK